MIIPNSPFLTFPRNPAILSAFVSFFCGICKLIHHLWIRCKFIQSTNAWTKDCSVQGRFLICLAFWTTISWTKSMICKICFIYHSKQIMHQRNGTVRKIHEQKQQCVLLLGCLAGKRKCAGHGIVGLWELDMNKFNGFPLCAMICRECMTTVFWNAQGKLLTKTRQTQIQWERTHMLCLSKRKGVYI